MWIPYVKLGAVLSRDLQQLELQCCAVTRSTNTQTGGPCIWSSRMELLSTWLPRLTDGTNLHNLSVEILDVADERNKITLLFYVGASRENSMKQTAQGYFDRTTRLWTQFTRQTKNAG